jgi:hypothetical protein
MNPHLMPVYCTTELVGDYYSQTKWNEITMKRAPPIQNLQISRWVVALSKYRVSGLRPHNNEESWPAVSSYT